MEETPTISKAMDLLSGVNTTLKSDAVKFELSWQGFKDFDSMKLTAEANDEKERRMDIDAMADDSESLIFAEGVVDVEEFGYSRHAGVQGSPETSPEVESRSVEQPAASLGC